MKKKLIVKPGSLGWYVYIALIILSTIIIRALLINCNLDTRLIFLGLLFLFEYIYLRIYKFSLKTVPQFEYHYANELPFYMCNMTTILGIFACFFNVQALMAFCCSTGLLGACLAYLMPDKDFICVDFISLKSFGFYGYHAILIVSCISILTLNLHTPRFAYIIPVFLIAFVCLLIAHLANYVIRNFHFYDKVNYAFTYEPAGNAILEFLYKLIPIKCVYLFPCLFPFTLVYVIYAIIFNFSVNLL